MGRNDDYVVLKEENKAKRNVDKKEVENKKPVPHKVEKIPVKKTLEKTLKTGIAKETEQEKKVSDEEEKDEAPVKKPEPKSIEPVNEQFLETDVDKLYEIVREKGILKIKEASKMLGIDSEQVEEWGRILEEHKLVRLRYPPVGEPVLILKKFTMDAETISRVKGTKKLKPRRRVFIINLIVLIAAVIIIAVFTVRIPTIRITYSQAYLAAALIIIIGIILIFRFFRGRKNARKSEQKTSSKS